MMIEAGKITWTEADTIMSMDDVIDLQEVCMLARDPGPHREDK